MARRFEPVVLSPARAPWQTRLGHRTPAPERYRAYAGTRQVGRGSVNCSADATKTLDDRSVVQQYIVICRERRSNAREPVSDAVLCDPQFFAGWFLTSSPIVTANWRAADDNQWLVPFGGGFGKMARFFDQRMVWQLHLYHNAIHPRDLPYPKWQVRVEVALLFPAAK